MLSGEKKEATLTFGVINVNLGSDKNLGVRPVVCIPSDLLKYNTTTSSWDINVTK